MAVETHLAYAATRVLPKVQRVGIMRWVKGISQRRRLANSNVVLVSFPKSGRTWFRVMLSRCFAKTFNLDENTLIKHDNFHKREPRIPVFLSFHGTFIREVAGRREPASLFKGKKVILLMRNPIDVSVSLYFHLLGARTKSVSREMKGVPDTMDGITVEDFVLNSPFSITEIVRFMNDWTALMADNPNLITLRYEDFKDDPAGEMKRVSDFLGVAFTEEVIQAAVNSSGFEELKVQERRGQFVNNALRPRDPDNPNSFKVRRGKVRGYIDYLSDDAVRRAEEIVARDLTGVLGYN
jgi:hypothetical protein